MSGLHADDPTRPSRGDAGQRIAGELRRAILDGVYSPGERIRQETLAEVHHVSRVPVREALRLLEAEGLVVLVANSGAWVAQLRRAECDELYEIRERIEPLLLRYNAPELTDDDLDELDRLARAMEESEDVETFLALDRQFHLSCYGRADTRMLRDVVHRLWNQTQHYRRAYIRLFRAEGDRTAHWDHHLLVAALRRGDSEEAERVLAVHIRRTRLGLRTSPDLLG